MSERLNSAAIAEKAIVHAKLPAMLRDPREQVEKPSMKLVEALVPVEAEPAVIRQDVDRTFEMPTMLRRARERRCAAWHIPCRVACTWTSGM